MENASKALIMAAEVLIGILILTLAIYLVKTFGENAATQEQSIYQKNLTEFNEKFTKYETPTSSISMSQLLQNDASNTHPTSDEFITSSDVVTLINLVHQQNQENASKSDGTLDTTSMYYITLKVNGENLSNINENARQQKTKSILQDSTIEVNGTTVYKRYKCNIVLSSSDDSTGRVKLITVTSIT